MYRKKVHVYYFTMMTDIYLTPVDKHCSLALLKQTNIDQKTFAVDDNPFSIKLEGKYDNNAAKSQH